MNQAGGALRGIASVLLAAAAVSGVLYLVLAIYEYRIPFPQLWAASSATFLIGWLFRRMSRPWPEPGDRADTPHDPMPAGATTRAFSAADWWVQRLHATSGDVEWFDRVVRTRLVMLVTERLRQHHGVPLTGDPGRAGSIVGTELYEFLTAPLPRTPTPHELEWLLSRMEEI